MPMITKNNLRDYVDKETLVTMRKHGESTRPDALYDKFYGGSSTSNSKSMLLQREIKCQIQ